MESDTITLIADYKLDDSDDYEPNMVIANLLCESNFKYTIENLPKKDLFYKFELKEEGGKTIKFY
jgi:hypothetical protein